MRYKIALIVLLVGGFAASFAEVGASGDQVASSDANPTVQDATAEASKTTEQHMQCTSASEPANFAAYSLGPEFAGLRLTSVIRRCDAPRPDEPVRANYVSYLYGTCVAPSGEGGCSPPVEIQSAPACERSRADYEIAPGQPYDRDDSSIRGVPAATFDGGSRFEVYTGDTTVSIFSTDEKTALAAAKAAVPVDAKQAVSAVPQHTGREESLPAPIRGSLSGELSCD